MKLYFLTDDVTSSLTLWTLQHEAAKDTYFTIVKSIEEADIIFGSRHYHIHHELNKIKGKKLVWITYGATVKDIRNFPIVKTEDKYSYDARDKLFLFPYPTPSHKRILEEKGVTIDSGKFLGYPKMDLINYNYNASLEQLGLKKKPTVMYAPTLGWRTCKCYSSFNEYTDFLVYLSLRYNFNLIVRQHPYLLEQFPEYGLKLQNIARLNNVVIDESYNYYPIFQLADFLVGDVSSLTYEFLSTKKPIILAKMHDLLPKQFKEFQTFMYTADSPDMLEMNILNMLGKRDRLKDRRESFIQQLPDNSTKLILEYIKEEYKT